MPRAEANARLIAMTASFVSTVYPAGASSRRGRQRARLASTGGGASTRLIAMTVNQAPRSARARTAKGERRWC
ncbi:Hypothetical protein A7982_09526 [Minicystis rosea]|nr:Hypothetical protein A7982_09526 [Minicystis rosea]